MNIVSLTIHSSNRLKPFDLDLEFRVRVLVFMFRDFRFRVCGLRI